MCLTIYNIAIHSVYGHLCSVISRVYSLTDRGYGHPGQQCSPKLRIAAHDIRIINKQFTIPVRPRDHRWHCWSILIISSLTDPTFDACLLGLFLDMWLVVNILPIVSDSQTMRTNEYNVYAIMCRLCNKLSVVVVCFMHPLVVYR